MAGNPIAIFALAFAGIMLTMGAWFVRRLSRAEVRTLFGSWTRAEAPGAYWFWAVYHVAGFASFILALAAVTLYFLIGAPAEPVRWGDRLYLQGGDRYGQDEYPHAYAAGVILRVSMTGPYGPRGRGPALVGIEADPRGYRVFELKGAEPLGPPMPGEAMKFKGSGKRICEARIDGALALRLAHAWKAMLDRVRPPNQTDVGQDGEFYTFSAPSSRVTGGTWSPTPAEPGGLLAGIARAMSSYCRSKDAASLAVIEKNLGALEKNL
jgi:hypothetical protein